MMPRKQYSLDDVLDVVRRRRWAIVLPFWAVLVATVVVTASLPNRYESDVRIRLVPAGVTERYVPSAVHSTLDERLPAITEMVLNPERLRRIVDEIGLYKADADQTARDPVARIRSDFRIKVATPDSFVVTSAARDARTARSVAEKFGEAFIDENRRRSEVVAGAATDFLDARLEDARRRLEANEEQLAAFNRRHAGALPSQLQSNLQMLQHAQTELQAVRDAAGRDRDEALTLSRALQEAESDAGASHAAPGADAGHRSADGAGAPQIQAAAQELVDLQSRLKGEHPDVIRMKRRLAELQAQAEAAGANPMAAARVASPSDRRAVELRAAREKLDRQVASRQADEKRLARQVDDYKQRIEHTPSRETEVTALMRDYDTLKDVYSKLLAKKEEARISASLQENEIGERFMLVDPATLPSRPSSPNRAQLDIVGGLGGLLLAFALAGFLEYRDTSIRGAEDVASAFELPLLASIPIIVTTSERRWIYSKRALAWSALAGAVVVTVNVFWQLSR